MSDPIRSKKACLGVSATLKDVGAVKFNLLLPKDKIKQIEEKKEEFEIFIKQELGKTSITSGMSMYNMQTFFSYQDDEFLKEFDYGNILLKAHIPYCLHLPNEYEIEVSLSPTDTVLVIPRKIWTQKANSEGRPSDEIDFFADDRTIFFNKGTFITPRMPVDPREGWELNFTGNNVQKKKDTNGVFRFTDMYIQFDFPVTKEELENKEGTEKILSAIHDKALNAVNKLIDNYRFVTKEEYVIRLGKLAINMVYFIDQKQGVYLLPMDIETAEMNRSKIEVEMIEKMSEQGERPDIYELLLLDAQNSFNNKNYTLAVVQSFQALEIFLENFLIKELISQGKTEEESLYYLMKEYNWKTKTRLKDLLKELKGFSIHELDQILWMKWCTLYDDTRNEIIHKGKEADDNEVKEVLESNKKIIEKIKELK